MIYSWLSRKRADRASLCFTKIRKETLWKHLFSRLSHPAQRLSCLFFWWYSVAPCTQSALVQTASSAGYLDHTAVSMVCDRAFTRSVVDTYLSGGNSFVCYWFRSVVWNPDLYRFFTMESRKKLQSQIAAFCGIVLVNKAGTLGQFVHSIFITTFTIEGWALSFSWFASFLSLVWEGILIPLLAVSAFVMQVDNFGNDSLLGLQTNVLVNITLALLIITGDLALWSGLTWRPN